MPALQSPSSDLLQPRYFTNLDAGYSERIDTLLEEFPANLRRLSNAGVEAFRTGHVGETSTCFEQIHRSFPLGNIPSPTGTPKQLKGSIIESLTSCLTHSENPIIALSGGIDSLLLACIMKDVLGHPPRTATLVSHLPGYCEGETTLHLAEHLGLTSVEVFEVNDESFVANLPAVIAACEAPLYNLHPVSKWLFANALQTHGYTACITGDGADQIAAGKIAYDYLPLLNPLFKDQKVKLTCPFLSSNVIHSIRSRGSDTNKQIIRELAMEYLPIEFIHQKKRPCFTPPLNLSRYGAIEPTDCENEASPNDREYTFQTTLALLKQSHLNEKEICAPLPG